jgi:DNA-directed RNA polymerase subunit E'/Rpb7
MCSYIDKDIEIEIKLSLIELSNKNETINNKLQKIIGKNYKNNNGYLKKINYIENIETSKICKNDFSGDIICKVFLNVSFINPQIGDIIDCSIKENNNINIAVKDILKIAIIDKNLKLNIGQKVTIIILAKQMKYNINYINIVGKIHKSN